MVSIVEVTTKAQLRRFVEYPMELYKDVFIIMKDTQCQMLFFQRVLWECSVRKKSFLLMQQEELILPINREIS